MSEREMLQLLLEKMGTMESKMDTMESKMDAMQSDITEIKGDVRNLQLTVENELRPNIQRIAEGHLDLARNLKQAQIPSQELEILTVRVNYLMNEMDILKRKIS